jgi:pimeloyl-ACP methyl ester carboxylesterase
VAERIEIDGLTFAYEDTGGSGPTALFLHGLGGSANAWLAQLEACRQRGWRGIAYDQRGAGRSDKPEGPYSVKLWAEDTERLLDALEIERAALVGHSVGCMVAEHAALRVGERAWALAVCGGALQWRPEAGPVFEERVKLALAGRMDAIAETVATTGLSERCRREDPRLLGLMREIIASNDPLAYALWSQATAIAHMTDLQDLPCPLLAFCGSEDPVAPPAVSEQIAAAAPRGRAAVVEGAAHWCLIEDPEGTTRTLFAFLDEHAPGS